MTTKDSLIGPDNTKGVQIINSSTNELQPSGSNFAQIASFATIANQNNQTTATDIKSINQFNTPTIPEVVYNNLPTVLKKSTSVFETDRDKDIFLTGALTVLSGCFDTVEGVYDGREVYSNLNCFIIAPPASGKGAFVYAKQLAESYHQAIKLKSIETQKQAREKLIKESKKTKGAKPSFDQIPPEKCLFIPGNTSSAAINKQLMDNGGKGIICETEADTLSGALKQDWGGFSDGLRKAFHHECISSIRKGNNEKLEINNPRISVALSGTPSQVKTLIPSAEDGLFSRFIYYVFSSEAEWRDVGPSSGRVNLTRFFRERAEEVLKVIEFNNINPMEFNFSDNQWVKLNTAFAVWLDDVKNEVGGEAVSIIKRLGLIVYRLGMIYTSLRKFERNDTTKSRVCSDQDFESIMQLAAVYKVHALVMYSQLPKGQKPIEGNLERFYGALPERFQRGEAVPIGKNIGIESRSVDYYLKKLVENEVLVKEKSGIYVKQNCKVANSAKLQSE